MRTQVLEGNKQQIAQQVTKLVGDVVRAIVFVEEPCDRTQPPSNHNEFEAELDTLMGLGSANKTPADVSREAIYSPENP